MSRGENAPDEVELQGRSNVIPLNRNDDCGATAAALVRPRQRPLPPHIMEGLARMESNQIESGFDPKAEVARILANRARIVAELEAEDAANPPPKLPDLSDAELAKIMLAHPDPKWREAGKTGRWRRVEADAIGRDDSADDQRFQGRQPDDPFYAEARRGAKNGRKKVKIVMGTDVTPSPVNWLWPDWLAHGKLHILAGRPGCL